MKIVQSKFHFMLLFLIFIDNTNISFCSIIAKLFKVAKNQKNKFRPHEERNPKIDTEQGLSPYEKRQLYWYYKDFVARKEVHKIWKDDKKNITDDEIFSADSFLPICGNSLKFGKAIYTDKDYLTPIVYNYKYSPKRSNIIYNNDYRSLMLDDFGRLITEDELEKSQIDIEKKKKLNFFLNSENRNNYIWATLVSPCDGSVLFNSILEKSPFYNQNISLYIIYCDYGGTKERYTHYSGKAVELLNGRLDFLNENKIKKTNLNQKFRINRGDIIIRILEYYYPPLYLEKLVSIPIFMPCEGIVAWEKEHKKVFTKGERIIEFLCKDNENMKMRQLISPSRGFTESINHNDTDFIQLLKLDNNLQSYKIIPIGYPLGVMKLELNVNLFNHENEFYTKDDILIKMPCTGRLEYPLLKNNFILKNEVCLILILNKILNTIFSDPLYCFM